MNHELISVLALPTLPISYSSLRRRGGAGWIYAHDIYCVVVDRAPLTSLQMMHVINSGSDRIPPSEMNYTYAATLLYRKSTNPHGPSARPIYVAALEHTAFSCEYEPLGIWGRLTRKSPRPKTVFLGVFHAGGRYNLGAHENNFTDSSACSLLLSTAASQVGLEARHFRACGSASQGPNCAAMQ